MVPEEGGSGGQLQWWDYLQRPEISEDNFEYVARNATLARSVVYVVMGSGNASYRRNNYSNAFLVITTDGLENVMNYSLAGGRVFGD